MFAGIITGLDVENDINLREKGTINGNASKENWWKNPKVMVGAFRPRLFFLSHCQNVTLCGVTFKNSPSWTLHPYFSDNLKFLRTYDQQSKRFANCDGLDPNHAKMYIVGVKFSLGDDCIAVKSGRGIWERNIGHLLKISISDNA